MYWYFVTGSLPRRRIARIGGVRRAEQLDVVVVDGSVVAVPHAEVVEEPGERLVLRLAVAVNCHEVAHDGRAHDVGSRVAASAQAIVARRQSRCPTVVDGRRVRLLQEIEQGVERRAEGS